MVTRAIRIITILFMFIHVLDLPAQTTKVPVEVKKPIPPRRFDLEKFSPLRKQLWHSTAAASTWLASTSTRSGYFLEGWHAALNRPIAGRHPLIQAEAALSLVRAARFFQREDFLMRSVQSLTVLLQSTKVERATPTIRESGHLPALVNPISYASLLVLAIYEMPEPNEDVNTRGSRKDYRAQAEQLCNYLRDQQQRDGSIRFVPPAGVKGNRIDKVKEDVYAAQAVWAVMTSYQHQKAKWKVTFARKALSFYRPQWKKQQNREVTIWQIAGWSEAFLQTKDKDFADIVYQQADWLCALQYEPPIDADRVQWLGAFRIDASESTVSANEPTANCAGCASALARASRVAQTKDDQARLKKYVSAAERCLQFLITLQYSSTDTEHFTPRYRRALLGGFRHQPSVGRMYLESHQRGVSAMLQYFSDVAGL